jgi:hypothetical protein
MPFVSIITPSEFVLFRLCRPQSSSASRLTAGALGFLTFTLSFTARKERPPKWVA